jgi:hypothetical protein
MLKNKTLNELKDLCAAFDIHYSKNARKQDIVEAINEAKVTWEMYKESSKSLFDYVLEPKIESKDAEEKEFKMPEIKETKVQTKILLKMISGRGAYLSRGYLFTIDEPFVFVPEDIANSMKVRSKDDIREATAEELAQFYGVN